MYDYIIVGGGISGLYANYLLNKKKYNVLLLEKENYLGGRAIEIEFHGRTIKLGAGVVGENNKNLIDLLDELKVGYHPFTSVPHSLRSNHFNMVEANLLIVQKYMEEKEKNTDLEHMSVSSFLNRHFDKPFIINYYKHSDYLDYKKTQIEYYIKNYKIIENQPTPHNFYYCSWTELINKLKCGNIITNYTVNNFIKVNDYFIINNDYKTKNIIFALPYTPLQTFLPKINKYLGSIPFIRIYTYHNDPVTIDPNIKDYTLVSNELQKIIKISDNILMAAYADNVNASYWYKVSLLPKEKQIKIIQEKLNEVGQFSEINDVIIKYWSDGVHYIKKYDSNAEILKQLQHPRDNIYIIGEILSKKQGWVEGCIESVNRVIKPL